MNLVQEPLTKPVKRILHGAEKLSDVGTFDQRVMDLDSHGHVVAVAFWYDLAPAKARNAVICRAQSMQALNPTSAFQLPRFHLF